MNMGATFPGKGNLKKDTHNAEQGHPNNNDTIYSTAIVNTVEIALLQAYKDEPQCPIIISRYK